MTANVIAKLIGSFIGRLIGVFLLISTYVWIASWAFDFTFTWKLAAGVYAVAGILRCVFPTARKAD